MFPFYQDYKDTTIATLSLLIALHLPQEIRSAINMLIIEIDSYDDSKKEYTRVKEVLLDLQKKLI